MATASADAIEIRPATPADAAGICAAHVASIRGLCARDYGPAQIEAWAGAKRPELYRRAMADEGAALFVAVAAGEVVGFSEVCGDEVRAIYVRPEYIRCGLGGRLLHAVEEEARRRAVAVLRLHSTLGAEKFYAAHGYCSKGTAIFNLEGIGLPCVKMSKPLRPEHCGASGD